MDCTNEAAKMPLPTASTENAPHLWINDQTTTSTNVRMHKRFGNAKQFATQSLRPCSAPLPLVCNLPEDRLQTMMAMCAPAVANAEDRLNLVSRPSSAAPLAAHTSGAPRPQSGLRVLQRPSSALSVSTRDANDTVDEVFHMIRSVELQQLSVKATRKRRNNHHHSAGTTTFAMTALDDSDEDDVEWRDETSPNAAATALGQSAANQTRPIPDYLTKGATWKRLWRTRADQEREAAAAIREQCGQRGVDYQSRKLPPGVQPYTAALAGDQELSDAILASLGPTAKLELLRADPEKRRAFGRACDILRAAQFKSRSNVEKSSRSTDILAAAAVGGEKIRSLSLSRSRAQSLRHPELVPMRDDEDSLSIPPTARETAYFEGASKLTHDIERQRRPIAAKERAAQFHCARLLRAAEDVERVDVMRSKHFADAKVELQVNGFATMVILASHLGSWLLQASKRIAANNPAAAVGPHRVSKIIKCCDRLITLRLESERRVAAKRIWMAWLRCRNACRRRRRVNSISLIRRFLHHRSQTTRFVFAAHRYLATIRGMQSWWRGTTELRRIRRDLAVLQVQRFLKQSIQANLHRVAEMKDACHKEECVIANRKNVPRLVKSQQITALRRETETNIASCQHMTRRCEALRDAPELVLKLVEAALEKRHKEYHQQVSRFAKSLSIYEKDVAALREKGVIVVRRRGNYRQRGPPGGHSTASTATKSAASTPLQTSRGSASRLASPRSRHAHQEMDTMRSQTSLTAQVEALSKGGKVYIDEPTTLHHRHHPPPAASRTSVAAGGSLVATARGANRGRGADALLWAALKERGVIGHIPVRPVSPFFHALLGASELAQLVDTAPI